MQNNPRQSNLAMHLIESGSRCVPSESLTSGCDLKREDVTDTGRLYSTGGNNPKPFTKLV
jgi:hypothetical protein